MALDELFEDAERLKLRFVAGFDGLRRRGLLSESEFEELLEVIDRLDEVSGDELAAKLEGLIRKVEEAERSKRGPDG